MCRSEEERSLGLKEINDYAICGEQILDGIVESGSTTIEQVKQFVDAAYLYNLNLYIHIRKDQINPECVGHVNFDEDEMIKFRDLIKTWSKAFQAAEEDDWQTVAWVLHRQEILARRNALSGENTPENCDISWAYANAMEVMRSCVVEQTGVFFLNTYNPQILESYN